jgi:hypothetical protein
VGVDFWLPQPDSSAALRPTRMRPARSVMTVTHTAALSTRSGRRDSRSKRRPC